MLPAGLSLRSGVRAWRSLDWLSRSKGGWADRDSNGEGLDLARSSKLGREDVTIDRLR